jgi:hypothetical protein
MAAPIAPKSDETFRALLDLHPYSPPPVFPVPTYDAPRFNDQHVREALFSFSPTSAAGLFGYRPSILQQCARAESFHFVPTLTQAVNFFASGTAPMFLQPFLAGGVSIALAKPNKGVRPLCCGDPLRRLVAKCFCLGGKGEISRGFHGKNFGVGCPGGVEAVAHSLRDVLQKHRKSGLPFLKLISRMLSTLSTAKLSSKLRRRCSPDWNGGLGGVTISLRCWFTIILANSFRSQAFNKVTHWALSTFAAVSSHSLTKSQNFALCIRSGTWTTEVLLGARSCCRRCGRF